MTIGCITLLIAILASEIRSPAPLPSPDLGQLVKQIIIENVPLIIDEKKGWGDQAHIFDGFKVSGKGFKARMEPRKKLVNHGLWKHYRITVIDPPRDLVVRFPRMEYLKGKGIAFTVEVLVHAHGYFNMQQHSNGVQVFSAATEAEMDLRIVLEGMIGIRIEPTNWLPDLLLQPRVDRVTLELPNIDVERFGKLKGRLVHETGDSFRRLLEDKLNDKEDKVPAKINKEIAKKWDEGILKISLTNYLRSQNITP
ncbi:hypothetical protein K2Y11_00960 [bacterium]|nr:hypothetical protein [bacterium]